MSNINQTLKRLVRREILELSTYQTISPIDGIQLHAMENPYGWPIELKNTLMDELKAVPLNRYPDGGSNTLKQCLNGKLNLDDSSDILFGNGSDELLLILMLALQKPGCSILTVEPTFVMYKSIAAVVNMKYHSVPLTENFSLDIEKTITAIKQYQPSVTFLSYPNNPTANCFDEKAIEAILQAATGIVVLDEAYHLFAKKSFVPRLTHYHNLLVLRTFSKMGLAGLRLGYAIGNRELISVMNKVRLPYNINVLTQQVALFALKYESLFQEQAAKICAEREVLMKGLQQLSGVIVWPTEANFILFKAPGRARLIHEGLKQQNIFIKCLDEGTPALKDCLRVSVGTPEENQIFLEALKKLNGTH